MQDGLRRQAEYLDFRFCFIGAGFGVRRLREIN